MIIYSYTTFRALFAPGASPDVTGWETWPALSVIYPPGETGFNLTLPTDLTPVTLTISANSSGPGLAGADDPTPFFDLFDWYVSQRDDGATARPFTVYTWRDYPANQSATTTKSGTIIIEIRPAYGFAGLVSIAPEHFADVYRNVFVYVRRRSNGHIMWGNLLDYVEGLS